MSSQDSINGEIKEQLHKLKDMSFKDKVKNLWYYYKIHALIAIIIIAAAAAFIHDWAVRKDYAFYGALINAHMSYDTSVTYSDKFSEYAEIDTDKYMAYFDLSFKMLAQDNSVEAMSSTEKISAMLHTGAIDVIVADTYAFEFYAQNDCFMNLENVLPGEVLEKYKDYLYYTDADTYVNYDEVYSAEGAPNRDTYVINHHSKEALSKPVPVGVFLPKESSLLETGCYDYLTQNEIVYQGYPSEAVLGIPSTTDNIDMILKFLDFLR